MSSRRQSTAQSGLLPQSLGSGHLHSSASGDRTRERIWPASWPTTSSIARRGRTSRPSLCAARKSPLPFGPTWALSVSKTPVLPLGGSIARPGRVEKNRQRPPRLLLFLLLLLPPISRRAQGPSRQPRPPPTLPPTSPPSPSPPRDLHLQAPPLPATLFSPSRSRTKSER